jgi:hypothetical protein
MHACSLHICNHALLHLRLLLFILEDGLWSRARAMLFKQRLIYRHACVINLAMFCFTL